MRDRSMPEPRFQQLQHAFADHIRRPDEAPLPAGVSAHRMAVYSELFFNNVAGFLGDSFPVIRSVLPEGHWYAMVREFYARHACATPLFTRLGEEFLQYLQQQRGRVDGDPPFLAELAHYEWVELALTLSDAAPLSEEWDPSVELQACEVRLSPLAWPLRYRYPVHRIGADFQPPRAGVEPVYLLVYRDAAERVQFVELDAWAHALLSLLQSVGQAGVRELLEILAEATHHPDPGRLAAGGVELCRMLLQRGVLAIAPAGAGGATDGPANPDQITTGETASPRS